jgi:hypothetical protein
MDISGLGTHAFPLAYTCGFQGDLHVLVTHIVTTFFFGTADRFGKREGAIPPPWFMKKPCQEKDFWPVGFGYPFEPDCCIPAFTMASRRWLPLIELGLPEYSRFILLLLENIWLLWIFGSERKVGDLLVRCS